MESYKEFSYVYDELMDNLDYDMWFDYLKSLLDEFGKDIEEVVELGCGTGTVTKKLADAGYKVTGVDLSEDMLMMAMNKNYDSNIIYIRQDITKLELLGKYDAFVSVGDTINYITDLKELEKVFKGVRKYLNEDGVFVFDLKTRYLYESIGDSVIADNRDDLAMIWENSFEDNINEYLVTLFMENENGLYEKTQELHRQRAYSIEEIKEALGKAGFGKVEIFNAFTKENATLDSERYYVVARI